MLHLAQAHREHVVEDRLIHSRQQHAQQMSTLERPLQRPDRQLTLVKVLLASGRWQMTTDFESSLGRCHGQLPADASLVAGRHEPLMSADRVAVEDGADQLQ